MNKTNTQIITESTITTDVEGLIQLLGCGRETAKAIGELAQARVVVNGRFCPQSVRNFCPIVAGFNAGTYKVPACVL